MASISNMSPGIASLEIPRRVMTPISVDGVALWENGVLQRARFVQTAECLKRWPEMQMLFQHSKQEVGVGL